MTATRHPIATFDQATAYDLGRAFDAAWDELQRTKIVLPCPRSANEIRELIARRIIAYAAEGERDTIRLQADALAYIQRATFTVVR